jgi:hypothetical protein
VRKLPGMTKYSNIVLKWGITDDMTLYRWHRDAINGIPSFRRNGSIVLLDRQRNEVARWNFVRAWPTKYNGPDFNAEGTVLPEYERALKLDDGVVRYLITLHEHEVGAPPMTDEELAAARRREEDDDDEE